METDLRCFVINVELFTKPGRGWPEKNHQMSQCVWRVLLTLSKGKMDHLFVEVTLYDVFYLCVVDSPIGRVDVGSRAIGTEISF